MKSSKEGQRLRVSFRCKLSNLSTGAMSAGDQSSPLELNGGSGAAATGGGEGLNGNATENGLNGAPGEGATMNGGGGGGGDGGTLSPGGGAGDVSEEAGTGAGDPVMALDAGCSDGPPSIIGVGPPSPLTGCYLLIIVGEPHSQDHKDIILQRLIKGKRTGGGKSTWLLRHPGRY